MKRLNFVIRSLTGVLFVALVLGCIFYGQTAFSLLFVLVAAFTSRELAGLLQTYADCHMNRNLHFVLTFMFTVASASLFNFVCREFVWLYLLYFLLFLWMVLVEIRHNKADSMNNIFYQFFVQAYVSIPFSLLLILPYQVSSVQYGYSWHLPFALFLMLWASDTGAYCFGSLFGKHKLAPAVSPGKTWEGSIGGLITTIAVGILMASYFPIPNVLPCLSYLFWGVLSLFVCVAGTIGDLVESLIKRHLGIKDSGNILPGHGGLLDRFDSTLFAAPLAFLFFWFVGRFL